MKKSILNNLCILFSLFACAAPQAENAQQKKAESTTTKSEAIANTEDKKEKTEKKEVKVEFPKKARLYYAIDDNTEYHLLHDFEQGVFYFFKSKVNQGKGQALNVLKQTGNDYTLGNENGDTYDLSIKKDGEMYSMNVTFPNGKKLVFNSPLHTNCFSIGSGNTQENIVTAGPPIYYLYFSTNYKQGIMLSVVSLDMMGDGNTKVCFPDNNKLVYELTESEKNLKVKNPDGSVQLFNKL